MAYTPPPQLTIRSTLGVSVNNGVKMMVYGLAGSGKTRLCATAPRPIILSAENGLLSLNNQDIPFIQINTLEELQAARVQIHNDKRFDTVCLDSASDIAERVLQHRMATNKDPRKAYGEMAQEVLNEVRMFRDFPQRHVLFIMKQGKFVDQSTGVPMWGPLMPGQQLDQHMPYMFDELFQLVSWMDGNGQRQSWLRTQRDNQNEAKDRSGRLDQWEPANLTHIINKISGMAA